MYTGEVNVRGARARFPLRMISRRDDFRMMTPRCPSRIAAARPNFESHLRIGPVNTAPPIRVSDTSVANCLQLPVTETRIKRSRRGGVLNLTQKETIFSPRFNFKSFSRPARRIFSQLEALGLLCAPHHPVVKGGKRAEATPHRDRCLLDGENPGNFGLKTGAPRGIFPEKISSVGAGLQKSAKIVTSFLNALDNLNLQVCLITQVISDSHLLSRRITNRGRVNYHFHYGSIFLAFSPYNCNFLASRSPGNLSAGSGWRGPLQYAIPRI